MREEVTRLLLIGLAGVLAPGFVGAVSSYAWDGNVGYAFQVFVLFTTFHGAVWLALGALTRRFRSGFGLAFALGTWLSLAGGAAAMSGVDHPYVYVAVYLMIALATTLVSTTRLVEH